MKTIVLNRIKTRNWVGITFIRQIKVSVKHYNIKSIGFKYSMHDFVTSITMPDLQSSDMRHIR